MTKFNNENRSEGKNSQKKETLMVEKQINIQQ